MDVICLFVKVENIGYWESLDRMCCVVFVEGEVFFSCFIYGQYDVYDCICLLGFVFQVIGCVLVIFFGSLNGEGKGCLRVYFSFFLEYVFSDCEVICEILKNV